jgi:AraC-like DNA-binding protein
MKVDRIFDTAPAACGIRRSRFSTDDVARPLRIDYWRHLHRDVADVMIDEPAALGAAPRFRARLETWRLGPFVFIDAESSNLRLLRRGLGRRASGPEQWSIRVSLDKPWRTRIGDAVFEVAPGAPFLQRVVDQAESDLPPGRWRVMLISADGFPELSAGLRRLRPGPQRSPSASLLSDIFATLPRRLACASDADAPALIETLRSVCAGCLLAPQALAASAPSGMADLRREQVIGVIRRNIGSARLDVDMISRLSGVSRSGLYRMFEGTGGVARVVRDLRLKMVMDDLRDPGSGSKPISVIAERAGFHCAASFSRLFREAYGCTPSEARAAALAGAAPCDRPDAQEPDRARRARRPC